MGNESSSKQRMGCHADLEPRISVFIVERFNGGWHSRMKNSPPKARISQSDFKAPHNI
jgi:hypothetical protein